MFIGIALVKPYGKPLWKAGGILRRVFVPIGEPCWGGRVYQSVGIRVNDIKNACKNRRLNRPINPLTWPD